MQFADPAERLSKAMSVVPVCPDAYLELRNVMKVSLISVCLLWIPLAAMVQSAVSGEALSPFESQAVPTPPTGPGARQKPAKFSVCAKVQPQIAAAGVAWATCGSPPHVAGPLANQAPTW